jgi:hypothetical protein
VRILTRLSPIRVFEISLIPFYWVAAKNQEETVMCSHDTALDQDLIGHCSLCGRVQELFELPGRTEKYCLECSADLAVTILLETEIDAATSAGRNTKPLVSEFTEVSSRLLGRAQSAEMGN